MHLETAEAWVQHSVSWLRLGIEVIGVLLIVSGGLIAVTQFLRSSFRSDHDTFVDIRLTLARYLALALEFQLAADILSTAIAPGWEQIGKLAAIAVIRTGLNFFLSHEMKEERSQGNNPGDAPPDTVMPSTRDSDSAPARQ